VQHYFISAWIPNADYTHTYSARSTSNNFYLAEFTRTYSSRVLAGASADPLIDINTAVMRGLRDGGVGR